MKKLLCAVAATVLSSVCMADEVTLGADESLELTSKSDRVMNYTVLGTLTIGNGAREELNKSGSSIVVKNGGTLNVNCNVSENYGNYPGLKIDSGASITVENGGRMVLQRDSIFGSDAEGLIKLDGGTLQTYRTEIWNRDYMRNIELANGGAITGGFLGAGWMTQSWSDRNLNNATLTVSGTAPSSVETTYLSVGGGDIRTYATITNANGKANNTMFLNLEVADVTGSDASDLIVSSEVTVHPSLADWPCEKVGLVKRGSGTAEFTTGFTAFKRLKIESGLVKLTDSATAEIEEVFLTGGNLAFGESEGNVISTLHVTANSTLFITGGTKITISALEIDPGVTLALAGDLAVNSIAVPALDETVLDQISFNGQAGVLSIENGYLMPPTTDCRVTFIGFEGVTLDTQIVPSGSDATAPEIPVIEGYRSLGWDKAFTNVVRSLTVTAIYKLYHTVTFVAVDGVTVIETQEVFDGESAVSPDPPTIEGFIFVCWDADFSTVTTDLTVRACYEEASTSREAAARAMAARGVGYVWAGSSSGTWDSITPNWFSPNNPQGARVPWQDGATAVFAYDVTITVPSAVNVAGLGIAETVKFEGDGPINIAEDGKIEYEENGTAEFACPVAAASSLEFAARANIDADTVCENEYLPLGEENAIKLFSNRSLANPATLKVVFQHRNKVANDVVTDRLEVVDDALNNVIGISRVTMNSEGTLCTFECKVFSGDYSDPYVAKVAMKQVGSDIYGYIIRTTKYSWYDWNKSIDGYNGGSITVSTTDIRETSYDQVVAIQSITLSERNPSPTEVASVIADNLTATEITLTDGDLTVAETGSLGEDGVFTGKITTTGVFTFGGTAMQTLRGDRGCAGSGKFVIAENAYILSPSGTAQSGQIDIYGTLKVTEYGYNVLYKMSAAIKDGGTFILGGNGNYDCGLNLDSATQIVVEPGGRIVEENRQGLVGRNTQGLVKTVGGEIAMHKNSGDGYGDYFPRLELADGATVTGTSVGFGYRYENWGERLGHDGVLTVSGTTPSSIDTTYVTLGGGETTTWQWMQDNQKTGGNPEEWKLVVNDVTGDEASDLIVNAETRWSSRRTADWPAEKQLVTMSGTGTAEFTKDMSFNGVLALSGGTMKFSNGAKLDVPLLQVTENSMLDVSAGSALVFSNCCNVAWTEGKVLTFTGDLTRRSVRFSTDEQGLTPEQLDSIRIDGHKNKCYLDAGGYLRWNRAFLMLLR